MIFPKQSSEIINLLNFRSNWKKTTAQQKPKIFHLKIDFYRSVFFLNRVYSDRSKLHLSNETAENYRNIYVAEKRIVSKLRKIPIPN